MISFKRFLAEIYKYNTVGSLPDHPMSSDELSHQLGHHMGGSYHESTRDKYKMDSDYYINSPLRKGFNSEEGKIKVTSPIERDDVAKMSHNTSLPTSHAMTTYRGFDNGFKIHHMKEGDTFTDHGFTGTSLSPVAASKFSGYSRDHLGHRTIAEIKIPPGTKGHYLDHPAYATKSPQEQEFTLHRGTEFRVHGHSTHADDTGEKYHVIHLSVVGQHPAPVKIGARKR